MKFRLIILQVCGLFFLCMNMHGQYRINPEVQNNQCLLTGNLHYDLSMNTDSVVINDSTKLGKKVVYKKLYSPFNVGLYSLIIPGAGQFYTKNYLKGSIFLGAEILLWTLYVTYENKGDNQTNYFQNYADENWSAARYAEWINVNFSRTLTINNTDPNLRSWERVNWNELNAVEEAIGSDLSIQPTGFTHKLAPHGAQQYYEMIGKYSQFGGG
jgi:hypothetical protein